MRLFALRLPVFVIKAGVMTAGVTAPGIEGITVAGTREPDTREPIVTFSEEEGTVVELDSLTRGGATATVFILPFLLYIVLSHSPPCSPVLLHQ